MLRTRPHRANYDGQEEVDCGPVVDLMKRRNLTATLPEQIERELHAKRARTCDATDPTETGNGLSLTMKAAVSRGQHGYIL
eukprot:6176993-Pleurochrysis_carterae.AAC.1